jgi:hypothetical protein
LKVLVAVSSVSVTAPVVKAPVGPGTSHVNIACAAAGMFASF